jgi:hypothetical protein
MAATCDSYFCIADSILIPGISAEQRSNLFGDADGNDFKFGQIAPLQNPLLEQKCVVAFHQLEASIKISLNPAFEIAQALGQGPVMFSHRVVGSFHRSDRFSGRTSLGRWPAAYRKY